MKTYRLLPNDAQIALTCKHYNIGTILTFEKTSSEFHGLK